MNKIASIALVAAFCCAGPALAESADNKQPPVDKENAPKPLWETDENLKKQVQGGKYSSCTPNPFALCSLPRPGKKDPMRGCWDEVCN